MRIHRMGPAEVQRCWPWLSRLLAPAVEEDDGATLEGVREQLLAGHMGLASVHMPNASGVLVMQPVVEDGKLINWIAYLAGEIKGGPKATLRTLREGLAYFVSKAREAQCAELRLGGRDYARVFPDFEPYDPAHPHRLRKAL